MSSKQDKVAPRTATDLERKYNLGQFQSGVPNSRLETQLNQLNQSFLQFSADMNAEMEETQSSISNLTQEVANTNEQLEELESDFEEFQQGGSSGTGWEKADIIDLIYPIGSIYTAFNHADPSTLFGGTWERLQDAFLYACKDTETIGETGGEATHTLTIAEIPPHEHEVKGGWGEGAKGEGYFRVDQNNPDVLWQGTGLVGDGHPHNNMPPYIKVSMWRRTA